MLQLDSGAAVVNCQHTAAFSAFCCAAQDRTSRDIQHHREQVCHAIAHSRIRWAVRLSGNSAYAPRVLVSSMRLREPLIKAEFSGSRCVCMAQTRLSSTD